MSEYSPSRGWRLRKNHLNPQENGFRPSNPLSIIKKDTRSDSKPNQEIEIRSTQGIVFEKPVELEVITSF